MTESHPTEPETITSHWLTNLLRAVQVTSIASVIRHSISPIGDAPAGLRLCELRLEYDVPEAGSPRKLLLLCADPDPNVRAHHRDSGNYLRIVQDLADAAVVGLGRHRCMCAHMDPRTGGVLILLGDIGWESGGGLALLSAIQRISPS